ncbi:MAG: polyphenol oxidase family protein [Treponema sp.]|nr:polyphenol oxidase family protein [Treponema sp.]
MSVSDSAIHHFSVAKEIEDEAQELHRKYILHTFYKDGKPLIGEGIPRWGMSLKSAGSMRFRWTDINTNRSVFLKYLFSTIGLEPISVELMHSQDVLSLHFPMDSMFKKADGMITNNKQFVPVITVADCMPIFLFDPVTGVFGSLHSGWKGTGICVKALEKAHNEYGLNAANVCVVMGPHIRDCCYVVDEERAAYFSNTFTPDCVTPVTKEELEGTSADPDWNTDGKKLFRLSLEKANTHLLLKAGVPAGNIAVATDCTCSNQVFGSFRRETSQVSSESDRSLKQNHFTVQAAFCGYF